MLDVDRVRSLRRLATPVLSAYIDTNPATERNQGHPPGYLAWLKTAARRLERRLAADQRGTFRENVHRLERELQDRPPRARGIAAFVGPKLWEFLRLQVAVDDELHWGPPALKQLFWLLDEHRPAGVVVMSRTEARFFHIWLGEIVEEDRQRVVFDKSTWRKKDLVGPSHGGVAKRRGVQREPIRETSTSATRPLCRRARLPNSAVGRAAAPAPGATRRAKGDDRSGVGRAACGLSVARCNRPREPFTALSGNLHARVQPALARWQRDDEAARVEAVLRQRGSGRVAAGLEETLTALQEGRVGGQIIKSDLSTVRGHRRAAAVRVLLPELAHRNGVSIDLVAGPAARRLRQTDGIAARLHGHRGGTGRRVA
jgi:Bacterial archaeo-eukaryotic release factor family 10